MTIAARLNDRRLNGHIARRIPHPLDELIASVITLYRTATPSQRQAMVDELNPVAVGALCAFPVRLAAIAVRGRRVEPLSQGLVSLGMVAARLDDRYDHLYALATVNHSAVLLGTDLSTVIDTVIDDDLPEPALAQFRAFAERRDQDRSLEAFGWHTYGEGDAFRYR